MRNMIAKTIGTYTRRVISFALVSMAIVFSGAVNAHEIEPAIVDVAVFNNEISFDVELSLEAILADIDLSKYSNTSGAGQEAEYDRLRALPPQVLEEIFSSNWGTVKDNLYLLINEKRAIVNLESIDIPEVGNIELSRLSKLSFSSPVDGEKTEFQFGWAENYGLMVLRRTDQENGFAGYIEPGELSPSLEISGGQSKSNFSIFIDFIPVGFDHILPKGLDHILFVVGLFLFSVKLRPLLWQVTAFTLAHTITLALASLNIITVSPAIVEPLIAISIAYVALENLFSRNLPPWRPLVIFCFGLLHGLGFASVLADFGLPGAGLIAALIGFNIGVEIGQLTVIAVCFVGFGYWLKDKEWYRSFVSNPMSLAIGAVGLWWAYERVFL